MKEVTFLYKCQLCSETINGISTLYETANMMMMQVVTKGEAEDQLEHKLEDVMIHACDDEKVGIARLIGYMKKN